MKLTIIPLDKTVYINQIGYTNIDMTWVPDIDGKKVHAVQWLDDEGHVEFVGPHQNLTITELGVFEQAIELWNEKKTEEDNFKQQQLKLEEIRKREEEERLKSQFINIDIDDEYAIDVDSLDEYGFCEKPHIPPTENHIPPIDPILNEEEDEDLFYDIEELLKEI